jgi:BirA family transcriptional regulator, biotin operon repressor / biotin---[acetyl-CoA-carboxylase] ligase
VTIDTFILTALRSPSGTSISGGEIAQKLGVTRAAVWARVRELRALGYEIEASPHEGYRLLNSPDVLLGDDLMSRLKGGRWGPGGRRGIRRKSVKGAWASGARMDISGG